MRIQSKPVQSLCFVPFLLTVLMAIEPVVLSVLGLNFMQLRGRRRIVFLEMFCGRRRIMHVPYVMRKRLENLNVYKEEVGGLSFDVKERERLWL